MAPVKEDPNNNFDIYDNPEGRINFACLPAEWFRKVTTVKREKPKGKDGKYLPQYHSVTIKAGQEFKRETLEKYKIVEQLKHARYFIYRVVER